MTTGTAAGRLGQEAAIDPFEIVTFYGIVVSLPRFSEPLEENLELSITYAIANFDLLELSALELVPVYGPRRAYARWRERRRPKVSAPEPTA